MRTVNDHMTAIVEQPDMASAIAYVTALPRGMRAKLADLLYLETLSPKRIATEARA